MHHPELVIDCKFTTVKFTDYWFEISLEENKSHIQLGLRVKKQKTKKKKTKKKKTAQQQQINL